MTTSKAVKPSAASSSSPDGRTLRRVSDSGKGSGDDLLDLPAIVAVRRITIRLADRAEQRWRKLAANATASVERTPGGPASESLHDFRVALRSLATWVGLHNDILGLAKKDRRRLRASVAATSSMRDAEVLSARLLSIEWPSKAGSAAAEWWATKLRRDAHAADRVNEMAHDMSRSLAAIRSAAATVKWEQPVDAPWWFLSLAADLAPRVRTEAATLRYRLELITGPDRTSEQHRARLTAKKVRYLLEPIADGLPEARAVLRELKELQNRLGDLHDLHTALDAVRAAADASHQANKKRDSSLGVGFDEVSAVLQSAADSAWVAFEPRYRSDRAVDLLIAAVEVAAAALCARAEIR